MRFPLQGHYALDVSGNMLEVFATGAWNQATAQAMSEDLQRVIDASFKNKRWGVIIDGRRWILSSIACQNTLAETIKGAVGQGLTRTAYVMDAGMVKRAQIERTHPSIRNSNQMDTHYEREYFTSYFDALNWLNGEGFSPCFSSKAAKQD